MAKAPWLAFDTYQDNAARLRQSAQSTTCINKAGLDASRAQGLRPAPEA